MSREEKLKRHFLIIKNYNKTFVKRLKRRQKGTNKTDIKNIYKKVGIEHFEKED